MVTTTLSSMRQSLSEDMGDRLSFDTTSDGDAAGVSVVSAALLNEVGGTDPDYFEHGYLTVNDTDSAADGETRRVDTYVPDPDNPTMRVQSAFSVQIANGITMEGHRFSPT